MRRPALVPSLGHRLSQEQKLSSVAKFGQIGTEFTKDGLNAEDIKAGNAREIDTKDTFQMAV